MTLRRRMAARQAAASRVLVFAAAGLPLGVPLEDLLRVVEVEEILPLPLAHPALCGVVPTLEGVSPVYDLARVAGTPPAAPGTPFKVALFPHPRGSLGLRLDQLGGMADGVEAVGGALQKGLVSALPAALRTLVTGAATHQGRLFYFLSRDAFAAWVAAGG